MTEPSEVVSIRPAQPAARGTAILEMRGISKTFPGVKALESDSNRPCNAEAL